MTKQLYLFGALALVVACIAVDQPLRNLARLATSGVQRAGVVTGLNCSNHASFSYELRKDPLIQSPAEKPCHELAVGDLVPVYVLPADETIQVIGSPYTALAGHLIFLIGVALGLPALIWRANRDRAS